MRILEYLNENRSRLLDVKGRLSDPDDLVRRSLETVGEAYLKSKSHDKSGRERKGDADSDGEDRFTMTEDGESDGDDEQDETRESNRQLFNDSRSARRRASILPPVREDGSTTPKDGEER